MSALGLHIGGLETSDVRGYGESMRHATDQVGLDVLLRLPGQPFFNGELLEYGGRTTVRLGPRSSAISPSWGRRDGSSDEELKTGTTACES